MTAGARLGGASIPAIRISSSGLKSFGHRTAGRGPRRQHDSSGNGGGHGGGGPGGGLLGGGDGDIAPISIVEEMKTSYLDYAMSVIVSRALPDVRDGLKPVHRRILYSAYENGFTYNRGYRKSARIVGDVIGKYHPHGDTAIYDALARMTQSWSMRVPLIDGQGNFGSMDPDPPAAMRYTEARLARVANFLLGDIDKDTVNFQPNYDANETEPQVLPARFPNILVNGAGGIAVGMATNIPPHNLGEVLAACRAYIDDPAISSEGLMEYVKGPDFPTGAFILGLSGIRSAYTTGRGSILQRSRHHVEEGRGDRRSIVLTEIPFQVGKNGLVEKIAEAAKDKRIEGVSDIRDESNRDGVRIVIDLKRDATPEVVLNQLWRHTPAQSSLPGQHAGDPRRPPRNADAARHHRGLRPLPRGGHHPPLEARAGQGPRTRPHPARPGRRGHQPRRGGEADPRLGQPGGSAREAARPRMAGRADPPLHRAGRSGRAAEGRRQLPPVRSRRSKRSSSCASTA